jgi:multiple sugar transport system substrate-binding protein
MQMKIKLVGTHDDRAWWACLLLGIGLIAGVTGCADAPTSSSHPPLRPYEGFVLRIACPGEPATSVVPRFGRGWATRSGASIRVEQRSIVPDPSAAGHVDVWIIRPAELPRWVQAGWALPVPRLYSHPHQPYAWQDLLAIYPDRLLTWQGQVYALPLLGEAPLCFYRKDLFDDVQHQQAFQSRHNRQLAPPTTWEEFTEIAEYFHHHRQPGRTSPSLPPLPENDGELDREYQSLAASAAIPAIRVAEKAGHSDAVLYSFHYDLSTGRPRISSPGFLHALQIMKRLQPCRAVPNGRPAPEAFAAGQAVLCLADASWISSFQHNPAQPPFGICRVPGSKVVFANKSNKSQEVRQGNYVPYLGAGSWIGVVSRHSAHPDAAFDLLADLGGELVSRQILIEPAWGGGAFRRDHLADRRGWSSFNLDEAQTRALLLSLTDTLLYPGLCNPTTCLRIPEAGEHTQVLVAELRSALTGGKTAAEALNAVESRWIEIDKRTPGKIRAYYAHSLGLLSPP